MAYISVTIKHYQKQIVFEKPKALTHLKFVVNKHKGAGKDMLWYLVIFSKILPYERLPWRISIHLF